MITISQIKEDTRMKQAPWTHGALRVEGAYLYNGQTPFSGWATPHG
jgi:hypothetical protein